MRHGLIRLITLASLSSVGFLALPCSAEPMTIKQPGNHPNYGFELEPHLLLGTGRLGPGYGGGFGLGARGSIPIVDNGFIETINNSVAISFGVDWIHYNGYDYRYGCKYNGKDLCVYRPYYDYSTNYVSIPVTLQWNFFLSKHWSVMGELGPDLAFYSDPVFNELNLDVDLAIFAGGRWHFAESTALTLRVGYPSSSIGFSFLL
ncbi:MAG: hypothetical protein SFV15_22405 [Polyangiaceae bacterium]|nr:hypothetical protein [Polyangiaceae bacterium]